jgi:hypothetical protein
MIYPSLEGCPELVSKGERRIVRERGEVRSLILFAHINHRLLHLKVRNDDKKSLYNYTITLTAYSPTNWAEPFNLSRCFFASLFACVFYVFKELMRASPFFAPSKKEGTTRASPLTRKKNNKEDHCL